MALAFSNTSPKACIPVFFILVQTSANVMGIWANFPLISSAALNIAFLIMSAVIAPSDDSSFNSPLVTPRYCDIAFATIGAFSIIDRNSSPCSFPDAIAWVIWRKAESCSPWLAPDTLRDFCKSSVNPRASSLLPNASPASIFILAVAFAIST